MTKDYEITKRYQMKQMAKGLCASGCGRPLRTKRYCDECAKMQSFKANKKRSKKRLSLVKNGLCSNECGRKLVLKWTCRECADKINQYARNHRNRDIKKYREDARLRSQKYRFNGLREHVVNRDNGRCQICLRNNRIVVHHIDENPNNNTMENLICLCMVCHVGIERINHANLDKRFLNYWISKNNYVPNAIHMTV